MSSREDLSADSGSNQGRSNIGSHKTISGWGVCSSKHEFCAQDFDIVHLGINGIGHMVRSDGLEVIRHVNNRFFGSASGGLSRVNEVDSIGFISPRRGRKLARNGREERFEYAGNVLHDERVVRGLRLAMAILYMCHCRRIGTGQAPITTSGDVFATLQILGQGNRSLRGYIWHQRGY